VGVRWPRHPFIQAVIQACGFPLAAPSANRSNQLSPTTAEHVRKSLGASIPLIIDGGPSLVGIESSVLDLASAPPRLLRPGIISAESWRPLWRSGGGNRARWRRSPQSGPMARHYAPQARLAVLQWRDEADLAAQVSAFGLAREKIHIVSTTTFHGGKNSGASRHSSRGRACAQALYAELHRCDEEGPS